MSEGRTTARSLVALVYFLLWKVIIRHFEPGRKFAFAIFILKLIVADR